MNGSPCPEGDRRAAMTDAEFWDRVHRPSSGPAEPSPDDDPFDDLDANAPVRSPCPECGATEACSWDAYGRPLIHATSSISWDGRTDPLNV